MLDGFDQDGQEVLSDDDEEDDYGDEDGFGGEEGEEELDE